MAAFRQNLIVRNFTYALVDSPYYGNFRRSQIKSTVWSGCLRETRKLHGDLLVSKLTAEWGASCCSARRASCCWARGASCCSARRANHHLRAAKLLLGCTLPTPGHAGQLPLCCVLTG